MSKHADNYPWRCTDVGRPLSHGVLAQQLVPLRWVLCAFTCIECGREVAPVRLAKANEHPIVTGVQRQRTDAVAVQIRPNLGRHCAMRIHQTLQS